jgi:hypothetical protein
VSDLGQAQPLLDEARSALAPAEAEAAAAFDQAHITAQAVAALL